MNYTDPCSITVNGGICMRLGPINVEEFQTIVQSCSGKVNLITADGDLLIANGNLSAVIGLESFLEVAQKQDISIQCERDEDRLRIERFIGTHLAQA